MRNEPCCGSAAAPERRFGLFIAVALIMVAVLGGCAAAPRPPQADALPSSGRGAPQGQDAPRVASPAVSRTVAPPPVLPFDEAVLLAADKLFSEARLPASRSSAPGKHVLVIDPLIDGATGFQSSATRSMQARIVELVRTKHRQFEVRELTTASLAEAPLVLVGSLAGVDKAGRVTPRHEAYRIWLVLADLRSGTIVGKGVARAAVAGVDLTPTPFFEESPAWAKDRYVDAYLATCGGKVGDPIDPTYVDGILTAAMVGNAIEAYDAGRYQEALDLYESAAATPAGDQLRVHNGLYLASWKLGRSQKAADAFGGLVDYGLRNENLAIRFLFKPTTTLFWPPELAKVYPMWLEQLALGALRRGACLEITGHTSPTGSTAINDRLSLLRADQVASRLRSVAPRLEGRMIANGAGSRENIVGTGRDDETDALDRRVEFAVLAC